MKLFHKRENLNAIHSSQYAILTEKEIAERSDLFKMCGPRKHVMGKIEQEKSRHQLTVFGLSKDLEDYYNMKLKLPLSCMQII